MMTKNLPIWRDANRFLLAIEKAVKPFPRYHKYTLGTELRNNALQVCHLINRAWQHKNVKQCELLLQLKMLIFVDTKGQANSQVTTESYQCSACNE